ncbi:MAG: hypothetical protein ABSG76_15965 [Xanthobacteraceae bacterium]
MARFKRATQYSPTIEVDEPNATPVGIGYWVAPLKRAMTTGVNRCLQTLEHGRERPRVVTYTGASPLDGLMN